MLCVATCWMPPISRAFRDGRRHWETDGFWSGSAGYYRSAELAPDAA